MKKLKQKLKRVLAAFLREELLEYIGYNHKIPFMSLKNRFEINNLPFETLIMEVELPIGDNPYELENAIRKAKEDFANTVMNHIHVDARNLTNDKFYMKRFVTLKLNVQVRE